MLCQFPGSDSRKRFANGLPKRNPKKNELLSAEEECHSARRALLEEEAERQKLIESNLRLVVNIAKRYTHEGLALADLVEEENLGLIHSVGKFDPELGYRFSTYSAWCIRQTIERGLMNQARTVRLPGHFVKEMRVMLRIDRENFTDAGLPITSADLTQITQKTRADIERLKLLKRADLFGGSAAH